MIRSLPTIWLRILLAGLVLEAPAVCRSQEPTTPQEPAQQKEGKDTKATPPTKKADKPKAGGKPKAATKADDTAKTTDQTDPKDKPKDDAKDPPDGKAPDKGDAKPDEPEKEVKEKISSFLLEPGYSDWRMRGARNKFLQYATPPKGFYLQDFRFAPVFASGAEDLFLNAKSLGQADYYTEGRLGLSYGDTMLRGSFARNRFFEPTTAFVNGSERRVDRISLRQAIGKDFALTFAYKLDDQQQVFQPPKDPLQQTTRYRDIVAGGKLGNGYLNLNFLDFSFTDRTNNLPDTTTRSVGLGYFWELTPGIGLEGAYSRSWIEQAQQPMGRLDTLSLDGDFALGPATTLDVILRQRHLDLPQVQNAFARDQRYGAFQIAHRWHGWSAQAGLKIQEAERVNGDHTYIDVPRYRTLEGKLTGRLNRQIRMTLRGSTQSADHLPDMITADTRSLAWSGRDTLQLKFDGGWPNLNGYFQYSYRQWRNASRSTSLTSHAVTAGGDWQISPTLDFFLEYSHEMWAGKGENTDFPTLDNFVPDSRVIAIGLNWSLTDRLFLSANYSDFATFNDNPFLLQDGNVHGSFLTLNGRYRFSKGYEVGLTVAPLSFRDRVFTTQDYNATVFMLTGTARF